MRFWTFSVPQQFAVHAALNGEDDELTGKVFLSHDKQRCYLFFKDSYGRAVMSGIEALAAEINVFDLRSRYLVSLAWMHR